MTDDMTDEKKLLLAFKDVETDKQQINDTVAKLIENPDKYFQKMETLFLDAAHEQPVEYMKYVVDGKTILFDPLTGTLLAPTLEFMKKGGTVH